MGFDDLSSLAVDSVFATLGTAGTYHPTKGGASAINVIRRPRDALVAGFEGTSHFQDGGRFEVKASDLRVPPVAGDKLMLGIFTFEVRGDPFFADEQRKVYYLDCVPCRK